MLFVLFCSFVSHFEASYISLMVYITYGLKFAFCSMKTDRINQCLVDLNFAQFFFLFDYFVSSDSSSIKLIEKRNENMPT